MVRPIVPYRAELSSDHPYWLVELTLSGLIDQLDRRTSGRRSERLTREQVAREVLGWEQSTLSRLFELLSKAGAAEAASLDRVQRGPDPYTPLELDKALSDKLLHIEAHLHVFGAENQPAGLPDDARRVLLTEYWARLFGEPQRAKVRVPAAWFKDIAAMLAQAVERPVSPVMVIAAGHALLANIELQDNDATALRKRGAESLTLPADLADREDLVRNLSVGGSLVDDTIAALIDVAQLPVALYGDEAVQIIARLRLPTVVTQVVKQIRANGTGYRLWRTITTAYQAERYLLTRLPSSGLDVFLQRCSMLRKLDHALLNLLLIPPNVDGYPARSLTVEAIDERLRVLRTEVDLGIIRAETLDPDRTPSIDHQHLEAIDLDPGVVQAVCVLALHGLIMSEHRPERERAYAAHVLAEHEERCGRDGSVRLQQLDLRGRYRPDGLLHAAVNRLAPLDEDRHTPPFGRSATLQRRQSELGRWVRQAVRELASQRDVQVPAALLRPRRSNRDGHYETAWDWVSESALEAAIFTVLSEHDGVWRRQVAHALQTGMLSALVTPILAAALDDELEVDGVTFTPLPWMRELAILAISFQSSVDGTVLAALERVARLADQVASDTEPRADEAHAALWALADLALSTAATATEPDAETSARLQAIRQVFLDLADDAQAPSIQRAVAYGLVCTERLGPGDVGLEDEGGKEVRRGMDKLRSLSSDATVEAILGGVDGQGSRPPLRRALGDAL